LTDHHKPKELNFTGGKMTASKPYFSTVPGKILLIITFLALCACVEKVPEKPNPLPSWNEGAAKQAMLNFVRDVTNPDNPSYVPPKERIATFDNDGTLWAEKPVYFQFAFIAP
jgi:hypothetical protein